MIKRLSAFIGVILILSTTVMAQIVEEASLFTSSDLRKSYDQALQGDRAAQFRIAEGYREGKGVYQSQSEAVKWYRLAADQGHAQAQYWLGVFYEVGKGVPRDETQAFNWFKSSAERGYDEAQYALGMAYASGMGTAPDQAQSLYWLKRAGEGSSAGAQYILALMYRDGSNGVEPSPQEAFRWALLAAQNDYTAAQNLLGQFYERGVGTALNVAEAKKWYESAAKKGDADAQLNLGGLLINESESLYPQGIEWIKRAVDQDHPEAQYLLGLCYKEGVGVKQNPDEALPLIYAAREQHVFGAEMAYAALLLQGYGKLPANPSAGEGLIFYAAKEVAKDPTLPIDMLVLKGGYVSDLARLYLNDLTKLEATGKTASGAVLLGILYEQGMIIEQDRQLALRLYEQAAQRGLPDGYYHYGLMMTHNKEYEAAARWYKEAAQLGHPEAQWMIAQAYHTGQGVPKNPDEAFYWAKIAADEGIIEARKLVGTAYRQGWGTQQDPTEAYQWFMTTYEKTGDPESLYEAGITLLSSPSAETHIQKIIQDLETAANKGHSPAKLQLGIIYHDGLGVLPDAQKAKQWAREAEKGGLPEASLMLGYWETKTAYPDWTHATAYFRKASEQGNVEAHYFLGRAYVENKGNVDQTEGINALKMAASENHTKAQVLLGRWSISQRDWSAAQQWFERAAKAGNPEAQFRLGYILLHGFAGEADGAGAIHWFERAAAQDYLEAMYALGDAYFTGYGAEKNPDNAVRWLTMAAEKGFAPAQYRLGYCYENGFGVTKNLTLAKEWYEKASQQGHHDATVALEGISKRSAPASTRRRTR